MPREKVIRQDYEFIFEPSTGVDHPKSQYFSRPFNKGDGDSCQTKWSAAPDAILHAREKERERERGGKIYRCIARIQRLVIYFRVRSRIPSIKYAPPGLDKFKRRMTVLASAFVAYARRGWPTTITKTTIAKRTTAARERKYSRRTTSEQYERDRFYALLRAVNDNLIGDE